MTRSPLAVKLIDDSFLDENGKMKDDLKFSINNPTFKIHNSKFLVSPDDKFETMLFLSEGEDRKGEGGLRTKGYFKFSYKKIDDRWFICDFYGNLIKEAPENIQQKIKEYISSLDENQSINDLPLITVITVVFNGAKTLEETIQSVINQTYPNVEYIIIDGGSTDGTLDIIKKYEDYIDYWVSEKDKGIYDAMNKGIALSSGRVIAILNSDDSFAGINVFQTLVNSYLKNGEAVYYGDIVLISEDGRKYYSICNNIAYLRYKMILFHPDVFVTRTIYKKYGRFDLSYRVAADFEFLHRIFMDNVTFVNLEIPITNYKMGGYSNKYVMKGLSESTKIIIKGGVSRPIAYLIFLLRFINLTVKKVLPNLRHSYLIGRPIRRSASKTGVECRRSAKETLENKSVLIPVLGFTPHGGMRIVVAIANYLANKGYDVTILGPRHYDNFDYLQCSNKVNILSIGFRTGNKTLRWLMFLFLMVFHKGNYDIILATHFFTYWPSKLLSIKLRSKLKYFIQDIEYKFYSGYKYFIGKSIFLSTLRGYNEIIAANDYLAIELTKLRNVQISVFKLGINDLFLDYPRTQPMKIYDIIYFLRREPHKGRDLFNEIVNKLSSYKFKILVVSKNLSLLEHYRDVYNLYIANPLSDEDLIKKIDQSRLMVLTSYHEGFALPPLECMARGVVPVVTDCGGPRIYCVDGYNSRIIPKRDPYLFVEAIVELLSNPETLSKMSNNCRLTATNFRISKGLSSLVDYL